METGIDMGIDAQALHIKNKEKTTFIRILGALLVLSIFVNIVVICSYLHLHDAVIWHMYLEHSHDIIN